MQSERCVTVALPIGLKHAVRAVCDCGCTLQQQVEVQVQVQVQQQVLVQVQVGVRWSTGSYSC